MKLISAEKKHFKLIQEYLTPYEHQCVQLMSYVRKESENIFIITLEEQKKSDSPLSSKQILGIIYITNTIFHFFPSTNSLNKTDFYTILLPLIEKQKIKCISGESKGTEFIRSLFNKELGEPYQTNHYKLMTAGIVQNPPEELSNDDQIIRCTENDMELLFPIQKKYMNEEVAPFGKRASDAEVSIGLRQILKNQLCLALTSDDEIVAKANTNAIGINWVQLGGIYTHPLYRRNGYAWQLISAICRRTYKAGKKSALFVKDINVPAMELYKKIGFTDSGLYEICYF